MPTHHDQSREFLLVRLEYRNILRHELIQQQLLLTILLLLCQLISVGVLQHQVVGAVLLGRGAYRPATRLCGQGLGLSLLQAVDLLGARYEGLGAWEQRMTKISVSVHPLPTLAVNEISPCYLLLSLPASNTVPW